MDYTANMQIIEFDTFETAFPVEPGQEKAAKRRLMTLFSQADEQARVGGTSYVRKATSYTGETFAVKRLLVGASIPDDANFADEDAAHVTQGHKEAFYEEYRNQLLVSQMKGFPKLYGYGTIEGDPAIVMEWVEGVSLKVLKRMYDESERDIPAESVTAIGIAVLEVLDSAARLDNTLVHRDISPANIMIRTDAADVESQMERGAFDICLIDFGSASANAPQDTSFTMVSDIWRNGTPEYAPPEMLTQDMPHIDVLRKSQAIDVFALCSVLYELYAGHTPWRVAETPSLSPFRIKTEQEPEQLDPREPEDARLVAAIMSGLAIEQTKRPDVQTLLRTLLECLPEDSALATHDIGTKPFSALDTLPERIMPPGLYTPDSTKLKVANRNEGGRRASEPIAPYVQQPKLLTRRNLAIGCILLAGAAAGGALVARSCQEEAIDYSGYPTTSSIYAGDSLFPARKLAASTWILRNIDDNAEIELGSSNHEPGLFEGGLIKVHDPATNRYGFMTATASKTGQGAYTCAWKILPKYLQANDFSPRDSAGSPDSDSPSSVEARRFAAVREHDSGLWGYIDTEGTLKVRPSFESAGRMKYGYAPVRPAGDTHWGIIDSAGAQKTDARFFQLGSCSDVGLFAACEKSGSRYGFVDTTGNWAIADTFARVLPFTEGLAACIMGDEGRWGFIDTSGSVAIEAKFAGVRPFSGGIAPAQDADTRLWGLIDDTGDWHVEPRFLSIGTRTGSLFSAHGSPAYVYDIHGNDAKAWNEYSKRNGDLTFGYGYVDENGTWNINPVYGDTLIRRQEL